MTKEPVSNESSVSDITPDNGRAQHIRRWIDGKLKRIAGRGLAGGLGSVLMALPALAQATADQLDAFQFAESIPGVRSAKLLPNGDVQLLMTDGRTLIVAAENVEILESGAIMVADEAAGQIAQLAAVAETGAAAAAGVSGTGLALGGLGLAGAAAAAGGGGGSGSDDEEEDVSTPVPQTSTPTPTPMPAPPPPEPSIPTLNLAELQADAINNSSTEIIAPEGTATVEVTIGSVTTTAVPDAEGNWTVSLTQAEAEGLPQGVSDITVRALDAEGTELTSGSAQFDIDTVPPTVAITTFSGGVVLNTAEQDENLTISGTTDAENGQTVTVTLNGQTYTSTVSGGNWSVTVPAEDLAALPDGATIAVTADISDRAGNPADQASDGFDTDFTAPSVTLDPVAGGRIDLVDVTRDLTLTGTTNAEDGQIVTVTFEGSDYTAPVSGGGWSVTIPVADLAGVATGTPVSVGVSVNDQAGNPATSVTATVPVDLTGPSVAITPLTVGAALNAVEVGSDLTVTGTTGNVPDGQQVTVELNGQSYTGPVAGSSWSVTIPSADLVALADGGDFTVTADVADGDGIDAPHADVALSKDVTAPSLSIDAFSGGAVLNAAERGTDLMISGSTTAEDNQTVTVDLNGQSYTGAAMGGTWSVTVPAADLGALSDSATIAVSADVADAAGNPAAQATGSFDTDFTPPSLTISPLSDGAVMNLSEQATDLVVTGTSDAADGTLVSVELVRADDTVDISGTATVSGGTWTFTAPTVDLSSLQDGETYDVNASITDTAGNSNTATTSIDTDFTAPTLTMNPLSIGAVLDVVERGSDLTISGTTTAPDSQDVTVSLGGQDYTASISAGTWSVTVPASDLAALSDSSAVTVTASVEDSNGNPAIDATASFTTDFRPVLHIDSVGTNKAVPLGDAQSGGITVTGNSAGLAAGQTVSLSLNGSPAGSATVGAAGSWSASVPASAFTGLSAGDTLDFSATASVSGGPDPAPVTDQAFAHTPAPYVITEVGRSGSAITFAIHADPDRDVSGGLDFDADLGFDPSVVTFNSGSEVENDDFTIFSVNASGNPVRFGGAALSFDDLSQPLVTFEMTMQDAAQPIELELTSPQGGPTHVFFGTDGTDTLTGTNVDDIVRGGGGDDTIDLSGAGRDIAVFETNLLDNGFDTITGFTLGPAVDVSDAIMFSGLDTSTLRGSGTVVETLGVGDALGTNTGFVGLETQLSDLDADTIATAAEGLTGAQAGDEIYLLATDGTNSLLVKVDYTASDSATVEQMAQFDGLSDLSTFDTDNILLTDPTGASA